LTTQLIEDDCILGGCQIETCECAGCSRRRLRAWNRALVDSYLKPFGLDRESAVMSLPKGTDNYSRAAVATDDTSVKVQPLRKGSPYPIITAARADPGNAADSWLPVEFTPLFAGTPMLDSVAEGGAVGGGVVEAFGANSLGPEKQSGKYVEDGEEVSVVPEFFVPLGFAAGTSGAGYTLLLQNETTLVESAGAPTLQQWSPADTTSGNNKLAAVYDSGPSDTTAILAQLRRGVRKIISGFSSLDALSDDIGSLVNQSWLPSLFGRNVVVATSEKSADLMNRNCQVFKSSELDALFKGLRAKQQAHGPPVFEQVLDVQSNEWCGVVGGWQVKILWVFPDVPDSFRKKLPTDTLQKLEKPPADQTPCWFKELEKILPILKTKSIAFGAQDIANNFPYDSTNFGSYTPELCHLLAEAFGYNLQAFGITELKQFLQD